MIKTLRNILLAGTILLSGCSPKEKSHQLTEENFQKSEWIEAPYHREIWHSYMGEKISRADTNWTLYKNLVAEKNGFQIMERNGKDEIMYFEKKTILLPDLDSTRYVVSRKDTIWSKRNKNRDNAEILK